MWVFSKKSQPYALLLLSSFEEIACIQHHLAFLVACRFVFFSTPNSCFQPLKPHFLMYVLPLLNPFVNGQKGFCLPLRCVFLCVPPCVLQHFALHLAPKHLAFCTKTACVLHQNSLRFAPKCSAFCSILHCFLLQIAHKLVQIAVLCNANSYCLH